MPWFGLSNNDNDAVDDDEEEMKILDDLEAGASRIGVPSLMLTESNTPSSASSSSSSGSEEFAAGINIKIITDSGGQMEDDEDHNNNMIDQRFSFRALQKADRARIQQLHEEWFPVTYSDEFYEELVTNQRLATSGDQLFTCVATLDHQRNNNMYCQAAGEASVPEPMEDDEIIGCVVGAFLHPSRLNAETAELLAPNPQVHSKLFYIMTLGTVEEYRHYGIATSLVEQCMDLVQDDPTCGALYLHVIPFNHAAIRF